MHTTEVSGWHDRGRTRAPAIVWLLTAATLLVGATASARPAHDPLIRAIVRRGSATLAETQRIVSEAGGRVLRSLPVIDGFSASIPASSMARLQRDPSIASITPDGRVKLLHALDGYDPAQDMSSLRNIASIVGADEYWKAGFTGAGVDVALIDSGVAPVPGLTAPGKVLNGADLSFESQKDTTRHIDTFGHGTHMASIIGGSDVVPATAIGSDDHHSFRGIAPGARIVSVKVAASDGATDVSQVIAAIDWVVQHRNDPGMNIRVLNLSFGTDSTQSYVLDPLAFAAEVAWRHGIVVVVAAGNSAKAGLPGLTMPAVHPLVIAVGATDTNGTLKTNDDTVPSWSQRGDGVRNPDIAAPGISVAGARAPGSYIDLAYPAGRVGERYFRGSGTSQATAVVSGAAALILQQRPTITNDQLKALLMSTTSRLKAPREAVSSGQLNLANARLTVTPLRAVQQVVASSGSGSIDASRGTSRVVDTRGVVLAGEQDIFAKPWVGASWAPQALAGTSWSGGTWNGSTWTGASWSGASWSGASWSGASWSGASWSGASWSGASWSGASWSGASWSGASWSGASWSGASWSGASWSSASWSSLSWS